MINPWGSHQYPYFADEENDAENLWHSTQVHGAHNSPSRKGAQVLLDFHTNDLIHTTCLPNRAQRNNWDDEERTWPVNMSPHVLMPYMSTGQTLYPSTSLSHDVDTMGAFILGRAQCWEACKSVTILPRACPGAHLPCWPSQCQGSMSTTLSCPILLVLGRAPQPKPLLVPHFAPSAWVSSCRPSSSDTLQLTGCWTSQEVSSLNSRPWVCFPGTYRKMTDTATSCLHPSGLLGGTYVPCPAFSERMGTSSCIFSGQLGSLGKLSFFPSANLKLSTGSQNKPQPSFVRLNQFPDVPQWIIQAKTCHSLIPKHRLSVGHRLVVC